MELGDLADLEDHTFKGGSFTLFSYLRPIWIDKYGSTKRTETGVILLRPWTEKNKVANSTL